MYVSPLQRNAETGEIVKQKLGCDLEVRPDLKTWKLPYAGQKVSEIKDELKFYEEHPDKTPPDGESYSAFFKRSVDFFRDQIRDAKAKPDEGILIVGNGRHSWALKQILSDVRSGESSTPKAAPHGEPFPGSLLKIELPSLKITPIYLTPAGDSQSL